jgi:hypothetical protein
MKDNVRVRIWVDVRSNIIDNVWSILKRIIREHTGVNVRNSVWDNIPERTTDDMEGLTKPHIMHHLCKSTDQQLEAAYLALERI